MNTSTVGLNASLKDVRGRFGGIAVRTIFPPPPGSCVVLLKFLFGWVSNSPDCDVTAYTRARVCRNYRHRSTYSKYRFFHTDVLFPLTESYRTWTHELYLLTLMLKTPSSIITERVWGTWEPDGIDNRAYHSAYEFLQRPEAYYIIII